MAQVIRSPKQYDVCIIGSGAGGGMAAKVLTEGGLNCVLLEAGPNVFPEKDFKMFTWPYELPHRGAGVGGKAGENFGEFLAPNGAWKIEGEPYTSAPGSNFQWFRSRIVGGRTNHWGRIALRFAPIDFKSATRDGLGDDWPIRLISSPRRATGSATIGPSRTKISRRITTKWNPTSGFSERKKMYPAHPTAFSCLLPNRAAPN